MIADNWQHQFSTSRLTVIYTQNAIDEAVHLWSVHLYQGLDYTAV